MAIFASARPRPVYLEIPVDVIAMDADGMDMAPRPLPAPPAPDPFAVAEAGYLLANAARPLMILGGGAVGARDRLRWIAEHLSIPVITSINAKGMLPPDHALLAGENLAAEPLRAEWKAADVILAVGTEFGETEMYPGPAPLPPRAGGLIRIDIDPEQAMRGPRAEVAMVADARLAALALTNRIDHAPAKMGGETRAKRLRTALAAQLPDYARRHRPILAAIEHVLPDATIVGDSTEMVYAANQFFHPRAVRRFFNATTGYGTLGYGLPAGIGARIGLDGPVVVLAGDGGLLFTVAELAAAIEADAPVIVVVWNNGGYGEIRKYMAERAIPPVAVDLRVPDIAAIARGFGADAVQPRDLAGFTDALAKAAASGRTSVILLEEADFATI
ncbi:MAG: thiamine pyrophosphate-dependent enzyme [Zavarzinia sp.]|nr:thiamine pyrophosphate-dependent enzyme [Zavarzinia sp.]